MACRYTDNDYDNNNNDAQQTKHDGIVSFGMMPNGPKKKNKNQKDNKDTM